MNFYSLIKCTLNELLFLYKVLITIKILKIGILNMITVMKFLWILSFHSSYKQIHDYSEAPISLKIISVGF